MAAAAHTDDVLYNNVTNGNSRLLFHSTLSPLCVHVKLCAQTLQQVVRLGSQHYENHKRTQHNMRVVDPYHCRIGGTLTSNNCDGLVYEITGVIAGSEGSKDSATFILPCTVIADDKDVGDRTYTTFRHGYRLALQHIIDYCTSAHHSVLDFRHLFHGCVLVHFVPSAPLKVTVHCHLVSSGLAFLLTTINPPPTLTSSGRLLLPLLSKGLVTARIGYICESVGGAGSSTPARLDLLSTVSTELHRAPLVGYWLYARHDRNSLLRLWASTHHYLLSNALPNRSRLVAKTFLVGDLSGCGDGSGVYYKCSVHGNPSHWPFMLYVASNRINMASLSNNTFLTSSGIPTHQSYYSLYLVPTTNKKVLAQFASILALVGRQYQTDTSIKIVVGNNVGLHPVQMANNGRNMRSPPNLESVTSCPESVKARGVERISKAHSHDQPELLPYHSPPDIERLRANMTLTNTSLDISPVSRFQLPGILRSPMEPVAAHNSQIDCIQNNERKKVKFRKVSATKRPERAECNDMGSGNISTTEAPHIADRDKHQSKCNITAHVYNILRYQENQIGLLMKHFKCNKTTSRLSPATGKHGNSKSRSSIPDQLGATGDNVSNRASRSGNCNSGERSDLDCSSVEGVRMAEPYAWPCGEERYSAVGAGAGGGVDQSVVTLSSPPRQTTAVVSRPHHHTGYGDEAYISCGLIPPHPFPNLSSPAVDGPQPSTNISDETLHLIDKYGIDTSLHTTGDHHNSTMWYGSPATNRHLKKYNLQHITY